MTRNRKYSDIQPGETTRDEFVEKMLPYVKYVAHRIAVNLPPSVDIEDLMHYGVLGLLDAYEKFDAEKGVRFKIYAEARIRGAILDGMRGMDWMPRSARRKRRELEAAYRHVEQELGRPATDEEIADYMKVELNEFTDFLKQLRGISLCSLEEVDQNSSSLMYREEDSGVLIKRRDLRKILADALGGLPEKERLVCALYYYDELTMKEIGEILGLGESRVSQLHTKAVIRLKNTLEKGIGSYNNGNGHSF